MRGPHACAPEPQPRIFRIWKLRLQFRKNYQLNLQIQYFRQPKNTNEDGNNLRVQSPSVRASKENCKPILLRGTADCFDCSSGGATAATIMSARSIQLTARMAWPRRQCVRGPSKAWRPRILALVARATCSRSTTMRARAGVTMPAGAQRSGADSKTTGRGPARWNNSRDAEFRWCALPDPRSHPADPQRGALFASGGSGTGGGSLAPGGSYRRSFRTDQICA